MCQEIFQIFEPIRKDNRNSLNHTNRKRNEVTEVFNVLKKLLKKEFGRDKYEQYARFIRQNVKDAEEDYSEIFNDLYGLLRKKDAGRLVEMQEQLNVSLLDAFYVSRNYLGAFAAYLAAFVIIASVVIRQYAVWLLLFISLAFLVKTYEFLVNKFCYVDARLVLIYKEVLDRVRAEKENNRAENV